MQRTAFAIVSLVALAPMTGAASETFETARGAVLTLPSIAGLSCAEMENTLDEIDATRYRENAPVPHDPADAPLYSYEMELARQHYGACVETQDGAALRLTDGAFGN